MSESIPSRPVEADRNLLLGILALQMDFISRDELIAAMNTWVLNKSRPLGQVLLDQGRLKQSRLEILEALVREHIQAHCDDPLQSLAAVQAPAGVCRELAGLADPALHATIDGLLIRSDTDVESTVDAIPAREREAGDRYRILRPHARGGLGEVFVAEDQELHREVALKAIQAERAHDGSCRERFVREAEITGGLEHPGVVPVYGLGQYADGRPFYAMRFIRGETLKDAIENFHQGDSTRKLSRSGPAAGSERIVAFRQLLGRFIAVCNTVAYAHSRGVLHRDLKPSNILLGKYGETLVVDWGLAKAMGGRPEPVSSELEVTLRPQSSGSLVTHAGAALGTPAYMSPEQAAGKVDQLGPASDIYGLGATLYTLLTGKVAVGAGNVVEVIQRVQKGKFPPPRELDRFIHPALEAICLKAMALDPKDRYGSARALADDVEHWLADEPTSAYEEALWARLVRWGRRHKPLLASAAALLLAALAALAAGTVLLSQANARTQEQRDEAQRQRDLAQENFQKARQAVDDYLVKVSDSTLLTLTYVSEKGEVVRSARPGMQPLRKELLEAALKYYQEFLQQRGEDSSLQAALAAAYFRVGNISDEVGSKVKALEAFSRARDLYEAVARAQPQDTALQNVLAKTHRRIGDLQEETGRPEDAVKSYEQSVVIGEKLPAEQAEFQSELARSYRQLGRGQHFAGQPNKALESFQRAIRIGENLAGAQPENVEYRSDLIDSYNNMTYLQDEIGQFDHVLKPWARAIALGKELIRRDADNSAFQDKLAQSYFELAWVQHNTDQPALAVASLRDALEIWEKLVISNPAVTHFQLQVGRTFWSIGSLQCDLGQLDEALRSGKQALDILMKAVTKDPDNNRIRQHLAFSYLVIGKSQRKRNKPDEALAAFLPAAAILERLPRDEPILVNYNLACVWSLCSAVVGQGKAKLSTAEATQQLKYADQAIAGLKASISAGMADLKLITSDPDLDALRSRADFKTLVREMEEKKKKTAR